MNTRLMALIIGLLFSAGAMVVVANESRMQLAMGGQPDETEAAAPDFQTLDTNKDGVISYQEAQAGERYMQSLVENYQEADKNHDGEVDQSEFAAFEVEPGGGDLPEDLQTDAPD